MSTPKSGPLAPGGATPLVFFYSGPFLPPYARISLNHAASVWGSPIVLLTDASSHRVKSPVHTEDFTPWFDSTLFDTFLEQNSVDTAFRDGFWAKTLLRFFVLSQYMERNTLDRIAHAELDSVIFVSSGKLFNLDLPHPGLFIPWNPPGLAVASLVIANGPESLRDLLTFANTHSGFSNEMELLTAYLSQQSGLGFGLPTVDALMYPSSRLDKGKRLVEAREIGVLFDAARLGQWIFGIDPRNTRTLINWNHEAENRLVRVAVEDSAKAGGPRVVSSQSGETFPVANLHVHSKRVRQATSHLMRKMLFCIANLSFSSPVGFNSRRLRKKITRYLLSARDTTWRTFSHRFRQGHK